MTRRPDDDAAIVTDERQLFRLPDEDFSETSDATRHQPVIIRPKRHPFWRAPRRIDFGRIRRATVVALEREEALGTAFLFVPVGLLAGVLLYFSLPGEPAPWNLPAALCVLAAGLYLARGASVFLRRTMVAVLLVLTGMALAEAHTAWTATPMLGSDVTTRLTGRIVAIEERANGRTRFTVDVQKTERPVLRYAPDRVRVTAPGAAEGFAVGGGIHGVVRLTSPSGPAHPGGYDFAFHSYFDGIGANGFFLGRPEPVMLKGNPGLVSRATIGLERLRAAIGHQIQRAAPGRSGAVSATLVTGNKSGIPDDVTEALRVSGLAHILSISGLHMALVAATVMATLRLGFAFFPLWASRHPVRKYAAAGALAATGFYLFLAGAGVATQRSFVMLAIMLLALTFDRNAVTMRNLALAAVAVMLVAPDEVAGPGFQMSFAATAALIAVYGGWQDWRNGRAPPPRERRENGPVMAFILTAARYAFGIGLTSLVAGLATGLYAAYHFGRVAPYGLIANLAAMPVVTILIMPLAVAAVIAIPLGLHIYLFKAMAWAVELVITIAERVAALSPAVPTGQMPESAILAFTAGLVLVCFLSTRLRLVAVPFFALGAGLWAVSPAPMAILSEDGRQFAIIEGEEGFNRLLVNRSRPNAFVTEQWMSAYSAAQTVRPGDSDLMQCDKTLCRAQAGGVVIGYLFASPEDGAPADLARFCKEFDLVVFAEAPSPQVCADGTPVLSARMLALRGAAEIHEENGAPIIRHALPGPTRPWLDHRRYSRAARNLGDWRKSQ